MLYILSDTAKIAEAEAMALALTAVMMCPELAEPVKYTILYAWAYVESLQDVKTLLRGGRVPVFKTSADWKTGINSIKNVKESLSGEGEGRGLNYKEYLEVMLFLTNSRDRWILWKWISGGRRETRPFGWTAVLIHTGPDYPSQADLAIIMKWNDYTDFIRNVRLRRAERR